ncbi:hypothetical protein [Micromonospora inositola]|uniref:hypothetical protein n=1 Tax=Micromonospora inositola TaxID=47865 RepID=UPI001E555142|nr:hypothetical protein [Micromonospora inositola]
MGGPERGQGARDERGDRRREGADPQTAGGEVAERGQVPAGGVEAVEHRHGMVEQAATLFGQGYAARQPVEQGDPVSASSAAICRDTADWV